jgi:hypothetical protein
MNRQDPSGLDWFWFGDSLEQGPNGVGPDVGGGGGACGTLDQYFDERNPCFLQLGPQFVAAAQPTCEDIETAYVTTYLTKRHSPLAADARTIVHNSITAGIDERFIVALAGVETTYGTSRTWDSKTAGIYNVFSSSIHCAALKPDYFCTKINPYTSYQQAINGTIQQLNARLYSGLNSVVDIYNLYETGNVKTAAPALDLLQNTIYKNQLHGDQSDIRQSRCP